MSRRDGEIPNTHDGTAAQRRDDSLAGANYSPEKIPASGGVASPQVDRMPKVVRARIRDAVDEEMQPAFDELCAWEDDIVDALNVAAEASDRMAAVLELIVRMTREGCESVPLSIPEVHKIAKAALWPEVSS